MRTSSRVVGTESKRQSICFYLIKCATSQLGINEKSLRMVNIKNVLFHHDNARRRSVRATVQKYFVNLVKKYRQNG